MRIVVLYSFLLFIVCSCSNQKKTNTSLVTQDTAAIKQNFFPVTNYIKGQLFEIKQAGINPLKYITINGITDSVWIKVEDIDRLSSEFLYPEIDSSNLTMFFSEKNFLDQTINAFTFTYDPIGLLPDSIKLRHWDVYIDAESGKVKRIYLVKEISKSEILQLTWQSNKYFKITSIITDDSGNSSIKKEEKVTWDF